MSFHHVWFALILAGATTSLAVAGPVTGIFNKNGVRVDAKQSGEQFGEWSVDLEFRGNQRACVIVRGDHKPVTDLEIVVYELQSGESTKIAASDRGTRDLVGLVWTPPRTARYRVVIRNPAPFAEKSNPYNECYVTIK